jgi:DnaD/phage-associated family protein
MADYWLKLYIEILDDPKMATMPDRAWRRTIELFLVAKKLNKDGHLPDTRQIAWLLRMNPDELEHDMMQIASTGIVVQEVGGWFIPKFADRQAAVQPAERMSQMRDRRQKQQYYTGVTDQLRKVTQRTEADTETEAEAEANQPPQIDPSAEVFTAYQNNIGACTKITADKLDDDIKEFSADWVIKAITKAVGAEKRSLSYVEGILKGWKRDGMDNGSKPAHKFAESY